MSDYALGHILKYKYKIKIKLIQMKVLDGRQQCCFK